MIKAQATLPVLLALAAVLVSVAALVGGVSYVDFMNEQDSIISNQSLILADSALEEALLKIHRSGSYTGGTFSVPEGVVNIAVTSPSATTRHIVVTVQGDVRRQITADVDVTLQGNPLEHIAMFGGDDIRIFKSNSMLVGNLWTNDNVDLDDHTVVRGNVYAAGAGNSSSSQVRNTGRIEDNPATPEIEGNIYSIDRIQVINNGYVSGTAVSTRSVSVTSGGHVGSYSVDPNLSITQIPIPVYDFASARTRAQAAGTYYTSPAQFLNYLQLNGNQLNGGFHYIAGTGTLTFATGTTYVINGSIVTEGNIYIYSTNYTHTAQNNDPAIATRRSIYFLDQNGCNCNATVTGVVFAEQDIQLKHDQYTGSRPYAVELTGVMWGGDDATIEDSSRLTFDGTIASSVLGFNFSATGGAPSLPAANNLVEIQSWQIY